MSKAILKLEMPNGCKTCPIAEYDYGEYRCRVTKSINEMSGGRLDDCPLEEVPLVKDDIPPTHKLRSIQLP